MGCGGNPRTLSALVRQYPPRHGHQVGDLHPGLRRCTQRSRWSFFRADPGQVAIFVKNTTEAINKAARRIPLERDDVVLVSLMEHHSNDLPWREQAQVVHIDADGRARHRHGRPGRKVRPVRETGAPAGGHRRQQCDRQPHTRFTSWPSWRTATARKSWSMRPSWRRIGPSTCGRPLIRGTSTT